MDCIFSLTVDEFYTFNSLFCSTIKILMSTCTHDTLLHICQYYARGIIDNVNFSVCPSTFVIGSFTSFGCLRYERFIVALEEASRDMLPALKNKSLKVSFLFTLYFIKFSFSNLGFVERVQRERGTEH